MDILNHIDENGMLLCRGACPIVKVMQAGEGLCCKVYPRKKDGTRFPLETVISPVFDAEIRIRIGFNSDYVLQGDIGTPDRKDLTVTGDTVNFAACLEISSQPNRLMISEATLARTNPDLHDRFGWFDTIDLNGKAEPVNSYINKIAGEHDGKGGSSSGPHNTGS